MKKAIILILILVCISLWLSALDIIGSVNFNYYKTYDLPDFSTNIKNRTFINVGVYHAFPINQEKNIAIQPEILINGKGASMDYTESMDGYIATLNMKETLTYLNIPILLRLSAVEGSTTFHFSFGPSFNLLMSAKGDDGIGEDEEIDEEEYKNAKKSHTSFDIKEFKKK